MNDPVEKSLSRAVEKLPQPSLDAIVQSPVIRMTEHDQFTRPHQKRPSPVLRLVGCAAALALTFLGGRYFESHMVASIVDLDVNPGFEITANRRDEVIKVTAAGEDGWQSLPDINFEGMPLEDTVDNIIAGLSRSGYLADENSVLLLSVDGKSNDRTDRLEQTLTKTISSSLDSYQGRATIVRQPLKSDSNLRRDAKSYGISEGRLQLIDQIISVEPSLTREALCAMNVKELTALAEQYGLSLNKVQMASFAQAPTVALPLPEHSDDQRDPPQQSDVVSPPEDSRTNSGALAVLTPDDWDDDDDSNDDDLDDDSSNDYDNDDDDDVDYDSDDHDDDDGYDSDDHDDDDGYDSDDHDDDDGYDSDDHDDDDDSDDNADNDDD